MYIYTNIYVYFTYSSGLRAEGGDRSTLRNDTGGDYMYTYIYIYIHKHVCVYIYIYIHTYRYVYVCININNCK